MKKFLMFSAAALAVAMTFSCANLEEDIKPEIQEETPTGPRVLTLSFAAPTKTILPTGNISETPHWKAGDQIIIYYVGEGETGSETITIPDDCTGEKYEFETTYWGEIVAIYPASAAGVDVVNNKQVPYFTVPRIQDGSFSSANICVARTPATQRELLFHNATALFAITPPAGTTQLTITSLGKIQTSDGQRGNNTSKSIINNAGESGFDSRYEIVVTPPTGSILLNNDPEHLQPWYVSVYVDGGNSVILGDLNFDNGSAMGGFPPIKLKEVYKQKHSISAGRDIDIATVLNAFPVEAGKYYTLSNPDEYFHPYQKMKITSGRLVQEVVWAQKNVGAEDETDPGLYFAWGDVIGHKKAAGSETSFEDDYTFSWNNCPFWHYYLVDFPTTFEKYADEMYYYEEDDIDGKTSLELNDDAAFINWGGGWCMPGIQDLNKLMNKIQFVEDSPKVGRFEDSSSPANSILLPAGGSGNDAGLNSYGVVGGYWSKSIEETDFRTAKKLSFTISQETSQITTEMSSIDRRYGFNIRPICIVK